MKIWKWRASRAAWRQNGVLCLVMESGHGISVWQGTATGELLGKFREFGFGRGEDGDAGVGIFPELEKIIVGGSRFSGHL